MSINFRIKEGEEAKDVNYQKFKKDFLNPKTTVSELRKKYGISNRKYTQLRKKIFEETEIKRKPTISCNRSRIITDRTYIHKYSNGYAVVKYINNERKYYGTYKDLETAKKIRNKLIKCNWDKNQLQTIKKEITLEEELKCL